MTATEPVADFTSLGLTEPLLKALADKNYTKPTPIQARSIPHLLAGRDLLGIAQTGTGKTAAFALPMLQLLTKTNYRARPKLPRSLVLAPTRELATQIADSFIAYGKFLQQRVAIVFGGVGQMPQVQALQRGIDILVATPGRLLDLMESRHIRLDRVTEFVLDEADRMLDMGFIPDVRRIVKQLPKVRQTLLFSATMPGDITDLASGLLHNPVRVEIARAGKPVDRIDQRVAYLDNGQKRAALAALLQDETLKRVIVFTRTKRGADRVARVLEAVGVNAHAIHGNKSQNARQHALEAFRAGDARVLVATDIAARGIDIDDITHVINYELPNIPESYVHRIGRTARAGAEGVAIAFCAPDEKPYLRDIERLTKTPLTVVAKIEGMDAFANLPDGKKRGNRNGDEPAHFVRAAAKIEHGRRNNRLPVSQEASPKEQRGEHTSRNGGGDHRGGGKPFGRRDGAARGFGGERRDGDRKGGRPFNRDARPGGDRPRSDRADRPWTNRPERPNGEAGPRPQRADGERRHGDRDERRPFDRDSRPRGDRPQGDRGGRPDWNRADRKADGDRRQGDRPHADRPHGERPRPDWKSRERAPGQWNRDGERRNRPDGERPHDRGQGGERHGGDGKPREYRDHRGGHAGERRFDERRREGGGDRKPFGGHRFDGKPRHEGARPQGERTPHGDRPFDAKPRRDGGRDERRPHEARREGRGDHHGSKPRFDDRGRSQGPRGPRDGAKSFRPFKGQFDAGSDRPRQRAKEAPTATPASAQANADASE
jgi:ATP-dependent RNA helicase RhlE